MNAHTVALTFSEYGTQLPSGGWCVWKSSAQRYRVGLAHCWALKDQAERNVMFLVGLVFSWCLIT